MTLRNRHWIGLNGESLTGRAPPELLVYGPELTGAQRGEVFHIYKLFTDACLLALGEYHVRNRVLSDGSRVRCTSFMGRDVVQVWTSGKVGYDQLPHGIGLCFTDLDGQPVDGYSVDNGDGTIAPKRLIIVPGVRVDSGTGLPVSTGFWRIVYVKALVGGQGLWVNADRTFWMSYSAANPSVLDQNNYARGCVGPAFYNGATVPYDPSWGLDDPLLVDGQYLRGGFFGNRCFVFGGTGVYFEQGSGDIGIILARGGGVYKSKVFITPSRMQKYLSPSTLIATPAVEAGKQLLAASYGEITPEFTVNPAGTSAVALLRESPDDVTGDRWLLTRTVDVREETVEDDITPLPRVLSNPVTTGEITDGVVTYSAVENEAEVRELSDSLGTNNFTLGAGIATTVTTRTQGATQASDAVEHTVDAFYDFAGNLVVCRASISNFVRVEEDDTRVVSHTNTGQIGFPLTVVNTREENESTRTSLSIGVDRSLFINEKEFWIEETRSTITATFDSSDVQQISRWWSNGDLQGSLLERETSSTKETRRTLTCKKRDVLYLDRHFDLIVYVETEYAESEAADDLYTVFEWQPVMPATNITEPLTKTISASIKAELNGAVVFSEDIAVDEGDTPLPATIPPFTMIFEDVAQSVEGTDYSAPYAAITYPSSDPLVFQYVQQSASYTYTPAYGVIKKKTVELQPMDRTWLDDVLERPTLPSTWAGAGAIARRCHVQIARDPVTLAVAINVLWHKDPSRPQSWFWVVDQTGLKNLADILNIPDEKIRPVTLVSI